MAPSRTRGVSAIAVMLDVVRRMVAATAGSPIYEKIVSNRQIWGEDGLVTL